MPRSSLLDELFADPPADQPFLVDPAPTVPPSGDVAPLKILVNTTQDGDQEQQQQLTPDGRYIQSRFNPQPDPSPSLTLAVGEETQALISADQRGIVRDDASFAPAEKSAAA